MAQQHADIVSKMNENRLPVLFYALILTPKRSEKYQKLISVNWNILRHKIMWISFAVQLNIIEVSERFKIFFIYKPMDSIINMYCLQS